MGKYVNIFGTLFVMIGTIFSLWSALITKNNYVGTADWYSKQQENFKKDKKKVIIGIIFIIIGSFLQIISLFL